jgi:ankyrin repeat protein
MKNKTPMITQIVVTGIFLIIVAWGTSCLAQGKVEELGDMPDAPAAYRYNFSIPELQPTELTSETFATIEATAKPGIVLLGGIGDRVPVNGVVPGKGGIVSNNWGVGARHVVKGKITLLRYTLISDPQNPLIFHLARGAGYVYEQGRGVVITPSKERVLLDNSMFSLIPASDKGYLAAVKMLLAKGADVNAKAINGTTALIQASQNGHMDVVQALLGAGAEVNAKANDNGETALIGASQSGSRELVQALLAKGAEVNAKANNGATPLILASDSGHRDVVQALLGAGADVNAKANDGETALIGASQSGDHELVQALLGAGAEVNAKTNIGLTALMAASYKGDIESVRALLSKGADVNAEGNNHQTALGAAIAGAHADVKTLLVQAGAKK